MKHVLTVLLTTLLYAATATANPYANEQVFNFDPQNVEAGLSTLDEAAGKKWAQLESWQQNESWINEQFRLGVVGLVYEKGMIGATVSRNIVPDYQRPGEQRENPGQKPGWLVVDKIYLDAGPLLQLSNLAGSIFFSEYFPYVNVAAIYGRNFINVRRVDTYKQALLANPFKFKSIPMQAQDVNKMSDGEIVSTVTQGGIIVRGGVGILDMLGVASGGVDFGPKVKVHVAKQVKLTIMKVKRNEALIMVEDAFEKGMGIGLHFGVQIDEVFDAPVNIGINSRNGWSPIRINFKKNNRKIKSVIYRLKTNTRAGRRAYAKLMQRDLTLLDDLALQGKCRKLRTRGECSVVRELIKEGDIDTEEFNMGIDLIFYRTGFRNIFREARYNSTLAGGRKFSYEEYAANRIEESSSWNGDRQSDERYSALVPTSSRGKAIDTFIVDSQFLYLDTEADGGDIMEIYNNLSNTVNFLYFRNLDYRRRGTRIGIVRDKNYGEVRALLSVRFPAAAIRKFLRATEMELWQALATSAGLNDPTFWMKWNNRIDYMENDRTAWRDNETGDLIGGSNYREISEGERIRDFFRYKLKSRHYSMKEKAKMLIQFLRDNNDTKLLHRTMIEVIGRNNLLIRGRINGKFNKRKLEPYRGDFKVPRRRQRPRPLQ